MGVELLELEVREGTQCAEVTTPTKWSWHTFVEFPGVQALLQHPLGLTLLARKFFYRAARE